MPKAAKLQISKNKVIHPNSRKAARLTRTAHRDEKLNKKKQEHIFLQEVKVGDKLRWFHEQMDHMKKHYTASDVCALIERYLHRFDKELKEIEEINSIKGRQGRTHASRELALKTIIERERGLYNSCGLEIPDLTSAKNFALFKEWNCDLKYLNTIKLRKFSASQAEKPPRTREEATRDSTVSDSHSSGMT